MAEAGLPLSVRDLTVTGDRGRVILSVPALDLPAGRALGVRGPSGAGKSTLLFALAGLAAGAAGSVRWGDQEILGLRPEARARFRAARVGMIFQDYLLFDEMDAAGNAGVKALFAPRSERRSILSGALRELARLGIAETAGRGVASFSGGERQRVAVARALASDPAIVLADEPTASLHREAADRLTEDLISDVAGQGRSLVVVSHDARLLDRMDRVIDIVDGALAGVPA